MVFPIMVFAMEEIEMDCPKCGGLFETVAFNKVKIERCDACAGLWFDMLEKEDLLKMKGSEVIDIGDEQVGEDHDQMRKIDCPRCKARMIPMIDKDQFHIHYECCPSCYGAYFDAGEFRDLKEHKVVERFVQMLQTIRTHL